MPPEAATASNSPHSLCDRVLEWAGGLPPAVAATKRRHGSTQRVGSKRQRIYLGELSPDTMANRTGSPTKKPKETVVGQWTTPKRRTARSLAATSQLHGADVDEPGDLDDLDERFQQTPRANIPMRPPSFTPPSDSSGASQRSTSPVKMSELGNLPSGFEYEKLEDLDEVDDEHALFPLRAFLETASGYAAGAGILPERMKSTLMQQHRRQFRFQEIFSDTRDAIGETPDIATVLKLCKETNDCERYQEHEAGWNCFVHAPILKTALELTAYASELRIANITTARIQPKSLAPIRESGERVKAKIADFAIVLRPSERTKASFSNLEPVSGAPTASFNQTCLNTVTRDPIALSIETKPHGGDSDRALMQLSLWVSAQYKRLRLLAEAAGRDISTFSMPVLPLIIAQGAAWRLLAASQDRTEKITMWDLFDIGKSEHLLGIYELFAVLQLSMRWAQVDYRSWFEAHMLPLMPEQRSNEGD